MDRSLKIRFWKLKRCCTRTSSGVMAAGSSFLLFFGAGLSPLLSRLLFLLLFFTFHSCRVSRQQLGTGCGAAAQSTGSFTSATGSSFTISYSTQPCQLPTIPPTLPPTTPRTAPFTVLSQLVPATSSGAPSLAASSMSDSSNSKSSSSS